MSNRIEIWDEGGSSHEEIDRVPNRCPLCHTTIEPDFVTATYKPEGEGFMAVYRCTRDDCRRLFIAHYGGGDALARRPMRLMEVEPRNPEPIIVPDEVRTLSPMYVEIREQANAAEAAGLDQIVGMGLRKALEFLVKDYAKHEEPNETKHDGIVKANLGTAINNYIDDSRIKQCAERATWLGNDHAHYLVKWEDKDIEDLKRILHLTVNWIDSALVSDKLLVDMPEKKT